jgi:pimeloyl-ACP methyl ester carboxylesterase
VTGGLDAVGSRAAFLDRLARAPKPILLVRGDATPRKSAAEMAAMIDTPGVEEVTVKGALGAFEESAGDVASAVRRFLGA